MNSVPNKRPLFNQESVDLEVQPDKKKQKLERNYFSLQELPVEIQEYIFSFAIAADFKDDKLQSLAANRTFCQLSAVSKETREIAFQAFDFEKKRIVSPLLHGLKGILKPQFRAAACVLEGLVAPTKRTNAPSHTQLKILIDSINRSLIYPAYLGTESYLLVVQSFLEQHFFKKEFTAEEVKVCSFLLHYLSKAFSDEEIQNFILIALKNNQFEMILKLAPTRILKIALFISARNGHVKVLDWFKENQKKMLFCKGKNENTIALEAATFGALTTLNWIDEQEELRPLLKSTNHYNNNIALIGAINNRTNVLGWVKKRKALHPLFQRKNCNGVNIAELAACEGAKEALIWIKKEKALSSKLFQKEGVWNIAHYAAKYNRPNILEWIYQDSKLKSLLLTQTELCENIAHLAGEFGSIQVLDWIYRNGLQCPDLYNLIKAKEKNGNNLAHLAAYNGFQEVLVWLEKSPISNLLGEKNPHQWNIAHFAVQGKKETTLKWIYAHQTLSRLIWEQTDENDNPATLAAAWDCLEVLKWLKEEGNPHLCKLLHAKSKYENNVAHVAAMNGCLEILNWIYNCSELKFLLYENGRYARSLAASAAAVGCVKVLNWLTEREDPTLRQLLESKKISDNIALFAACNDQTEVLEWIYNNPKLYDLLFEKNKHSSNIALVAGMSGSIKVLDWIERKEDRDVQQLLKAKNDYGNNLAHVAAINGHVEILDWIYHNPELQDLLFETGEESKNVALFAAEYGHVNVLNWLEKIEDLRLRNLLKSKDKFESTIALNAAHKDKINVLEWIKERSDYHDQFHGKNSYGCNMAYLAARHNGVETLNWIQSYPPLLCLFLEVTPKNNFNIAHGAARFNCLQSLNWLNKHFPQLLEVVHQIDGNIAHMAVRNGHIDVLNWIQGQDHLLHLLTDKDFQNRDYKQLALELNQTKVLEWLDKLISENIEKMDECSVEMLKNAIASYTENFDMKKS